MSFYHVIAIPETLAWKVRTTLKAPGYGHPAHVFIHKDDCPAYATDGFPPELRDLPLTLEAYGPDRWIVGRERVVDGEVAAAIERLLAREEVGYIHVRNTEAGCYIARVERTLPA